MNAGKSTLINRITRQETSIVDSTPGTTADVKVALMELHDVGPAKLFDTAGIDEAGELGDKKRQKTLGTLKVCRYQGYANTPNSGSVRIASYDTFTTVSICFCVSLPLNLFKFRSQPHL